MAYGIANAAGQPDLAAVQEIVATVWSQGVRFFDTAPAYGRSEEVLGRALASLSTGRDARLITKLNIDGTGVNGILSSLESSRARLQVLQLWGALLHDEQQLDRWNDSVGQAFAQAKREGLVSHVGASIYSTKRALQALDLESVDVIQVPASVFDRRMERGGVFKRARECGKTVFVRSIFLQGLALMETDSIPERIPLGRTAVAAFEQFCAEHKIDRRHFALDYVRRMAPDAMVIIGAETIAEARENCALFGRDHFVEEIRRAWTNRWPDDVDALVDPRLWPSRN
jgi:aryl-alcohol dehydrogenase-like predicted oxidoreductase